MQTDQNKALPKALLPFIWHFLAHYKFTVALYVLLALAAGFWGPFNSLLIKQIINLLASIKNGDTSALILPASLVVVNFIIFDNITWRGINYIRAKYVPVIINCIIADTMSFVLAKSHQFFQDHLSGKVSKQITTLADSIEKLLTSVAVNFLRGSSLLLTAMVAAYFANPIFCLILLIWFAVFAVASLYMSKKLVFLSNAQALAESDVVGQIVDTLSNHSNVRIFARKWYESSRMAPFFQRQQETYTATSLYSLILFSVQGGLIATMMGSACYFLVYLYGKNLISIGDFSLILGLSMETGHMMWFTMTEVDEFNKAVGRCKQSLLTLMTPLEVADKPTATVFKCKEGRIAFESVKFHYLGMDALFQDKSIALAAGQKVGLVGYSGGGKSTFVNLILRFYDVTDGRILIDGQDIRNVTQDSLRTNIAMIPQEASLFQRSVLENIRYGCIEATEAEVVAAAKKAHAHDFIVKLPEGYRSLVGERGIKLSGGQRQRIAIARAILKNAPILILDEATSQLDSITEKSIQESLWQLMQEKTTLVVAHRLSTLLQMDRILVFDQGKIIEDGTHTQLLAQQGLYKTLWEAQVGGFLPDKRDVNEV